MARSLQSVTAGGKDWAKDVAKEVYPAFADKFPQKFFWFASTGYNPHEWQAAFHSASTDGKLCMYRHLVAGRRGGKTMSAARETLFYCLHPEQFHLDAHGEKRRRPLWVWVLTKDHEVGMPARQAMTDALAEAGLTPNKDYRWNKTEKKIEFENGTLLQFKSADDPQSLRGAGLDILWIDEAAFIPNEEAWGVVSPALADKIGLLITTTTPRGRNWFWKEFWNSGALADKFQFRVEYTSLDNPYFKRWMWERERIRMHPILFKQEYMAAFNAMIGIELHGDWLKYYSVGDPAPDESKIPLKDGQFVGRKYIGVDPASSLSDRADHFAMVCIGVSEDNSQAFVLATYRARIDFPDQLDKIREWWLKYRPEYIGIEANAYQRVLEQQVSRMEGMPPTVQVNAKGKKWERIMAMAPIFKIGKVKIHKSQNDFIEEWVNYDSTKKNTDDDLLDAAEIALQAAGVLLPSSIPMSEEPKYKSLEEESWAQIRARKGANAKYDPDLGSEA